jgi:tetratricopeptide (TPR) repeat protein
MCADSCNHGNEETHQHDMLAPGTEVSHYRIVGKIGEGGMGVVYKALDTRLDREVALKFLPAHLFCDSEARSRFEHEAKAASAMSHPNVTTIHEIDEVDGRCFIVMEYVDGTTIKDMSHAEPIPIGEIIDIAIQVAQGLKAAHEKSIVHRDIKSANIMVSTNGTVKIMDFGLAKLRGATKLTKTGTTMGTLHYMSPEQAQGKEVDRRSDIFSLGVVLYEMVTGKLPFKGEYEQAVTYSILNDTPEPMARYRSGVPVGLQRIVEKTLEKDREERYQDADDLLADLRHEKRLLEQGGLARASAGAGPTGLGASAGRSRKRLLRILLPALVAAAVAVVLFVFEPFRIEMGPKEEAAARENSLAIMYFENLADRADPDKLGEVVANLLITNLSESRYVNVVSGQRLYDILKLLGMEGAKVLDRDVASEVAARAKARWMLLGSILKVGPRLVLTAQLVDVKSGEVHASQRVDGEDGEEIFALVDRLTAEIRSDLSLPASAEEKLDRSVAEVTTHSPEAYRYYLDGVESIYRYDFAEAVRSFEKAVALDSTFAMAYYMLVKASSDEEVDKRMMARAIKYSDRVTERERFYILARAARRSGDLDKATEYLQRVLERYPDDKTALEGLADLSENAFDYARAIQYYCRIVGVDPLFKEAYNGLAYGYQRIGKPDSALWAAEKYISVAPNDPNPYDTRGEILALTGRLDQAIESYEKALKIKPDFDFTFSGLGNMYLFKREYAKAETLYRRLCAGEDGDWRSEGRIRLGYLLMYQGKFERALQTLDAGIAADRMDKTEYWLPEKYQAKAAIYRQRNEADLALEEDRKAWENAERLWPDDIVYWYPDHVRLLAATGDFSGAEKQAKMIKDHFRNDPVRRTYYYGLGLGWIERARGDLEAAASDFAKSDSIMPSFGTQADLAKIYLDTGRLGEAVAEYEKMLSTYSAARACVPIESVKAHYYLGQAYERSGWGKKAMEQYEEFLEIWKDADPGIAEIQDARAQLADLKAASQS